MLQENGAPDAPIGKTPTVFRDVWLRIPTDTAHPLGIIAKRKEVDGGGIALEVRDIEPDTWAAAHVLIGDVVVSRAGNRQRGFPIDFADARSAIDVEAILSERPLRLLVRRAADAPSKPSAANGRGAAAGHFSAGQSSRQRAGGSAHHGKKREA